jgi:hypothetical protein
VYVAQKRRKSKAVRQLDPGRSVKPFEPSHHVKAAPIAKFFSDAGFSTVTRGDRIIINGVEEDVSRLRSESVRDSFVLAHFPDRLRDSIRSRASLQPDDEIIQVLDGFEVFRGDLLFAVHATRARVPGEGDVHGNYLIDGDHWDKLTKAVERRAERIGTDVDDDLARALDRLLPGLQPLVLATPPPGLTEALLALALAASKEIRLHRQLALDRPAHLHVGDTRVRFDPVRAITGRFFTPFAVSRGSTDADGVLVLDNDSDPLPVVIDARADAEALYIWPLVLSGFAALACPPPPRDAKRQQTPATRPAGQRSHYERALPRTPRATALFTSSLTPLFGDTHAAHLVAGHRRRLHDGRQASDEAIDRALSYGIRLGPDETWVRPHARGVSADTEINFAWNAAESLLALLDRLRPSDS